MLGDGVGSGTTETELQLWVAAKPEANKQSKPKLFVWLNATGVYGANLDFTSSDKVIDQADEWPHPSNAKSALSVAPTEFHNAVLYNDGSTVTQPLHIIQPSPHPLIPKPHNL